MTYYEENKERLKKYSKQYYKDHKKEKHAYHIANRERRLAIAKKSDKKKRIQLLNIVSNNNPVCVRCGCDDIRLLEINHINGGGAKETRKGTMVGYLYNAIRNGKRDVDDLELLCRVCNAQHYLELKYGDLPYKITYGE